MQGGGQQKQKRQKHYLRKKTTDGADLSENIKVDRNSAIELVKQRAKTQELAELLRKARENKDDSTSESSAGANWKQSKPKKSRKQSKPRESRSKSKMSESKSSPSKERASASEGSGLSETSSDFEGKFTTSCPHPRHRKCITCNKCIDRQMLHSHARP